MAKALHPFIYDGRQYFIGEEVLAEGEQLESLKALGCVEDDPKPLKKSEAAAELKTPDEPEPEEPKRTKGKKKG